MKLIAYEKSTDIIAMFAIKTSVLCVHSTGLIQVSREDLSTKTGYQVFGVQDSSGIMVGALDLVFSRKHGTVKGGLFLEKGPVKLAEVCLAVKKMVDQAGLAKISLSLLCGEDGVADTMKEVGFLPEVKRRADLFIAGSLFSVTEYGCVL